MRTRIEYNIETGEETIVPVDDAWILARQSKQVFFSIPQLTYSVGQSATLTAQLKTPELADYSVQNVTETVHAEIQVGDIVQTVTLTLGQWSDLIEFPYAGSYLVKCLSHPGNELTIGVS